MRLVELLQVLALPLMVVALIVRRTERRLVRRLHEAEAYAPERAIAIAPGRPLSAWVLRRLMKAGVIIPVRDRGYLSLDALRGFRRRRKKRALVALVSLSALAAALLWWNGLRSL